MKHPPIQDAGHRNGEKGILSPSDYHLSPSDYHRAQPECPECVRLRAELALLRARLPK